MSRSNIYIDMANETAYAMFGDPLSGDPLEIGLTIISFLSPVPVAQLTRVVRLALNMDTLPDDFYLPLYAISPQEIFSDQIAALHVNFFNPKNFSDAGNFNSAEALGPEVARWYVAIRNLVLVALMVVLLYIGIRIVISSTSGDKAKYKENLKDWLIAVILVLFMHYIMAFALTITEYILNILSSQNGGIEYVVPSDVVNKIQTAANDAGVSLDLQPDKDGNVVFETNLMGYARLQQQLESTDSNGKRVFSWNYIGYTIIFIVLVIYTIMFLIIYFKRVIYMAFLTMIAPLVALTYPIDKITDGEAQAFNMWLKEYMYNLLLQPFHLLLYTVLVGSVMELATQNMIYAIVALGFLLPAEKLLRKFFGFEKANTTDSIMGGVIGGSMAMSAINSLGRLGSGRKRRGDNQLKGSTPKSNNIRKVTRSADKGKQIGDSAILNAFGKKTKDNNDGQENTRNNINLADNDNNNNMIQNGSGGGSQQIENREVGANQNVRLTTNETQEINNSPSNAENIRMATDITNRPTNRLVKNKKNSRFISGAKTLGKYTGRVTRHVPGNVARTITKGALGIAVGTAGIAAGVASGDLSNIVKYGAGAAVVGSKLGGTVSNVAAGSAEGLKNIPEELKSGYRENYLKQFSGDELEEERNKIADKDWMKSKETIDFYKDKFGDDYETAMNVALQYRQHGVTNDEVIADVMKLDRERDANNELKATDKSFVLASAADRINDEKGVQTYGKRLKELGIDEGQAKSIMKDIRQIKGI